MRLPRLPLAVLAFTVAALAQVEASEWNSLFNGTDLSGWIPKITKHEVGANPHDTFRVEDGILKVSYDGYEKFDGQYGHLYSEKSYSHYKLRMEYKFVGEMMSDAPHFVNLNSGFMVHSQSAHEMLRDQDFPVSVEFQFLADEGKGPRSTGNLCTPGTTVVIDDELIMRHIVQSSAPTFPADRWIAVEIEVRGGQEIIHRVEGEEVLRFEAPTLDPTDRRFGGRELSQTAPSLLLESGHIALQAEGQGIWFRNIEIMVLAAEEPINQQKLAFEPDLAIWEFDVKDGSPGTDIYSAADGVLHVAGRGQSLAVIRTQEEFSEYEISLQWRWPDQPGNSGLLIHCSEPRFMNIWPKSLEIQLGSGNAGDFIHIGETVEVPLKQHAYLAPGEKTWKNRLRHNLTDGSENPPGEWNWMRVRVINDEVTVWVNGELVNHGSDLSVGSGAICLQAEGANIEFRDIRLWPLGG